LHVAAAAQQPVQLVEFDVPAPVVVEGVEHSLGLGGAVLSKQPELGHRLNKLRA